MGEGGPPRKLSAISLMPSIIASSIQRRKNNAATAAVIANQMPGLICPIYFTYHLVFILCSGIGPDDASAQELIDVMLHVQHIVFHHVPQRDRFISAYEARRC
jgi:hypothetical protein